MRQIEYDTDGLMRCSFRKEWEQWSDVWRGRGGKREEEESQDLSHNVILKLVNGRIISTPRDMELCRCEFKLSVSEWGCFC